MRAIKITSLVKPVDVENDLKALQTEVQGNIEEIRLRGGGCMLVNEEGALNGMALNPIAGLVAGTLIYGPALIVGIDEDSEDYTDVPASYAELLMIEGPL